LIYAPLITVAQRLGVLRERVVFVGGMVRGLLITDTAASPFRPTDNSYVPRSIARLVGTRALTDALPGHLPADTGSQLRLPMLEARLRHIASTAQP
jgi:hypothetical protein